MKKDGIQASISDTGESAVPSGDHIKETLRNQIEFLFYEHQIVRQRGVALITVDVGGDPNRRYALLSQKKDKGWYECAGGELNPPDIDQMHEVITPPLDMFVAEYLEDVRNIRNNRVGRLRRTQVYEIMSRVAELDSQTEEMVRSLRKSWYFENLLREVGEETGIWKVPDAAVDLSHNFLGYVPDYIPHSDDRVVGGRLQLPYIFRYRMNKLPMIGEREEHTRGNWVRWPRSATQRSRKWKDVLPLLDDVFDGRLNVIQEAGRKDVFQIVTPEQSKQLDKAQVISPLSQITQLMLIHCLTAESAGMLR
ncbi:MAG: hypothetical protein M3Q44_08120 [bacterium]|nr:hypothetical protein [bacterium]